MVSKKLVINFPVLGKKHGRLIKELVSVVGGFGDDEVSVWEGDGCLEVLVGGDRILLEHNDLLVRAENIPGVLTAKSDGVLVVLNTSISQDLLDEGFAREFVNRVQNMRRDLGLAVTDTITLGVGGDDSACGIILGHQKYISEEVLAKEVYLIDAIPKNSSVFEFNNYKMYIVLQVF